MRHTPRSPGRDGWGTRSCPSNVLLIQNERDVSAPLAGDGKMRAAFGERARMVVVDAVGHASYVDNGTACGDERVTRSLLRGERPAGGVPARPDRAPARSGPCAKAGRLGSAHAAKSVAGRPRTRQTSGPLPAARRVERSCLSVGGSRTGRVPKVRHGVG
ncbi:alpha/beta hydrolase [Streptomyces sp. ISL-10]|uniref:alpha/beta hydrolase n=1 Tax=Streptomyces sp. ISL-10 TaxID=2819172 RepID=UPI001BEA6DD9|nr:alpha/beta hydrolase [Streptomyces sp. ISL-10]MBT2364789.1 alpha/beta hydrolase [Streptomyces sp. ISL-10]